MKWIQAGPAAAVSPGDYVQLEVDGEPVAVFNVAGQFCAVQDVCTHDGGGLAGGAIEGDVVVCSRHGARFCLRTGAVLGPPAYEPIRTFPTRVADGIIEVQADD